MARIRVVGETEGCDLYALLDEEAGTVFYIGVSSKASRRVHQHYMNGESSAFERCTALLRAGKSVKLVVLKSFENRAMAKRAERLLIEEHPALLNRKGNRERRDAPLKQARMPAELKAQLGRPRVEKPASGAERVRKHRAAKRKVGTNRLDFQG